MPPDRAILKKEEEKKHVPQCHLSVCLKHLLILRGRSRGQRVR